MEAGTSLAAQTLAMFGVGLSLSRPIEATSALLQGRAELLIPHSRVVAGPILALDLLLLRVTYLIQHRTAL